LAKVLHILYHYISFLESEDSSLANGHQGSTVP
jgi:hypothetical protein